MNPQFMQTLCQVVLAIGLIMAALGGYDSYFYGNQVAEQKERHDAGVGTLVSPKMDQTLAAPSCPRFYIGDSGACLVFNAEPGKPILNIMGHPLHLEEVDGRMVVSLTLLDEQGRVAAQLVKNEWKVNTGSAWDRNYTKEALEVVGSNGKVVLQVKLVPNGIRFQAKVPNPGGGYWTWIVAPDNSGALVVGPNAPENQIPDIVPIFRYPSKLHLGELVRPDKSFCQIAKA